MEVFQFVELDSLSSLRSFLALVLDSRVFGGFYRGSDPSSLSSKSWVLSGQIYGSFGEEMGSHAFFIRSDLLHEEASGWVQGVGELLAMWIAEHSAEITGQLSSVAWPTRKVAVGLLKAPPGLRTFGLWTRG